MTGASFVAAESVFLPVGVLSVPACLAEFSTGTGLAEAVFLAGALLAVFEVAVFFVLAAATLGADAFAAGAFAEEDCFAGFAGAAFCLVAGDTAFLAAGLAVFEAFAETDFLAAGFVTDADFLGAGFFSAGFLAAGFVLPDVLLAAVAVFFEADAFAAGFLAFFPVFDLVTVEFEPFVAAILRPL